MARNIEKLNLTRKMFQPGKKQSTLSFPSVRSRNSFRDKVSYAEVTVANIFI